MFPRLGRHGTSHVHVGLILDVVPEVAQFDMKRQAWVAHHHRPGGIAVESLGSNRLLESITVSIRPRNCRNGDYEFSRGGDRQYNLLNLYFLTFFALGVARFRKSQPSGGGAVSFTFTLKSVELIVLL